MATKTAKTPTNVVSLPITDQLPGVTLETLREQKKQLENRIKQLRDAQAKHFTLEDIVAQQEAKPNAMLVLTVGAAVRQRVRYGATLDEAVEGVLAICERLARTALDKPEKADVTEPEVDTEAAAQ